MKGKIDMFNKFYEGLKTFIKDHLIFLLVVLAILIVFRIPTGHVIYRPGGTIDITDRIAVNGRENSLSGSLNMVYVSMMDATLPFYLLARIIPSWELVPNREIVASDHETIRDANRRNRLFFEQSISLAKFLAYERSEIPFEVINERHFIIFLDENASDELYVGDEFLKFNGNVYNEINDLREYIENLTVGDIITLTIQRNNQEMEINTTIFEINGENRIGVQIITTFDIESEQTINIDSKATESGSSGGLMLTLAIYSTLSGEDITRGHTIVGTGTINAEAQIGRVGGIPLKVSGAVRNNADVFLVPAGANYEEARTYANARNYDIIIVGVETLDEALDFLKTLEVR